MSTERRLAAVGLGLVAVLGCSPEPLVGGGNVAGAQERIIVTTTDFATGALSVVSPDLRAVERDVGLASTDAIPFVHEGRVYVVNRFMHDYVDVYDPDDGWALLGQHPIAAPGVVSANPHGVAFLEDGRSLVTAYGASEVQVHDFAAPTGESHLSSVDLSSLADADGIAETSVVFARGGSTWVMHSPVARTEGWTAIGGEQLLRIDTADGAASLHDLDETRPGVQGIAVPGLGTRQVREDPLDEDAVYLLNSGVVRVDLERAEARWAVSEAQMAEAGLTGHLLPQAFDVSDDGAWIFIAAYRADFSAVDIFRVPADGGVPEPIVEGLNAVERTLEVVGEEIWFGDTTPGDPGVRAFDLDGAPLLDGALSTGLRPYAVAAF